MKPIEKKLENGLRIITVPMKDNPTVTVLVMVEAGARYETKETNGLSHFLEHMIFKGTEKRTNIQLAYELDSLGAVSNAFTGYDYTGYYAKGRAELFPKLVDIISDVYLNSIFPEGEIEKERGVICGEIDMIEDDPMHKVQYLALESLYGDQPAGRTIIGFKENILRFTREDFMKYRDAHYLAEKTTIVVAGNVSVTAVEEYVTNAFQGIKNGPKLLKEKVVSDNGTPVLIKNKTTDQSHLVISIDHVPLGHPDIPALALLSGIMGHGMSSRLFIKLREEMGAGYYVETGESVGDDTGMWEIVTGTEPKRVPEVVTAIIQEIKKISTELVTEEELAKTKEYLVGRTYMQLESSNNIAIHMGHQAVWHQPLKTPQDIEEEIRKVTPEDIYRVAQTYLKPEKFHLAIIGPHENDAEIRNAFHFL